MGRNGRTAITVFLCLIFFIVRPVNAVEGKPGTELHSAKKSSEESSLNELRDETLSYFTAVTGEVTSVEGNSVRIDAGTQKSVKAGMRLHAFKEGMDFVHPITKESLGKVELPVGNVEITSAGPDSSTGIIIAGKPGDFAGAKVKVPGTKIRILFSQGDVEWVLGDAYFQVLKESGRFELVDTGTEANDMPKILAEAKTKGAEAVLALQSEEKDGKVTLDQKLFWVGDAKQFSEKKVAVDNAFIKELKFKTSLFAPGAGEALLSFHLPFGARRLAAGDFDGDGNLEIALAAGDKVRIYKPGVDLKMLWEFKVPATDEVLWIDSTDIQKGRRDGLVITSIQNSNVTSYVYGLRGAEFVRLLKINDTFVRSLGSELIAQGYTRGDGYSGKVFSITYADGAYKKGEPLKLPEGVNIYDFQDVASPDGKQAIFAWDDEGRLSLYNDKGLRVWISKEGYGGFSRTFQREAPTVMVSRGKWSVKDRLVAMSSEVLAPKRKPLLGVAKGLGYKSSEIRGLWWNGLGVEDRSFIERAGGELLDYYPVGDRIFVLSKASLGMRAKNIFRGESPFGVMLYIFSVKGR